MRRDLTSHNTLAIRVPEPNFDIFCGRPDKNAAWEESVEGLAPTRERMEQIARENPGKYFAFSRLRHLILAFAEVAEILKPSAVTSETTSAA